MKYWGVIVCMLYVLLLVVVLMPLGILIVSDVQSPAAWWQELAKQVKDVLLSGKDTWGFWVYLGAVFLAQAALLSVPVNIAEKRPVTRRTVIPLVIASSVMMGLLAAGIVLAINETVRKGDYDTRSFLIILGSAALVWGFWAYVFSGWSKKTEPADLVRRQCRSLFKGSILELLIVVPAHILARHRNYCCAGFQTFIGIAFGISVMFFSFGPGVFFLFAERWRKNNIRRER